MVHNAEACTFVLDTETKRWSDLPPLPVPRYAPTTQLWRGRLRVMGGSGINRYTPEVEHKSLAVKDGKPLEKEWRSEIPILRGGPHRACVVANDKLMVIGGQEVDFMAKPGSPIFKCSCRNEVWTHRIGISMDNGVTCHAFEFRLRPILSGENKQVVKNLDLPK